MEHLQTLNVLSAVRQTNMSKQALCKTFATLCEAYITEVSTSLSLVQQQPGGAEVIKYLHKNNQLGHAQDYRPISKISWSELKDSWKGAWVIVVGSKATGAIRASGGGGGATYEAVALDPATGEIRKLKDGRGGNILDFLKPLLGKFEKYYVGKESGDTRDLVKKRAQNATPSGPSAMDQSAIIKKFKPLWVKAMTAAVADVKGMAQTMIKNDAYDKAEKKIGILRNLENAIEMVERGDDDVPGSVRSAVQSAIYMAAAHHYPEQTGEITRSRYGGGVGVEREEGPQLLLKDISGGDTSKLGTILAFFKRSLISA